MIAALFSFRLTLSTMTYTVHETSEAAQFDLNWQSPAWLAAETLEASNFRPESSTHRPQTFARLLHDQRNLHGIFKVHDRFVRCTRTGYGSEVWKDACVEFFIEPKPGRGYFNFEFNCGGAFLCNHIVDPARTANFFKQATRVPAEIAQTVTVRSTLPRIVDPEVTEPVTWFLQFSIPFAVMAEYIGPFGEVSGQTWRGNFFKCAEDNSHPHWASWSPVEEFNFHLPRCFGEIRLA